MTDNTTAYPYPSHKHLRAIANQLDNAADTLANRHPALTHYDDPAADRDNLALALARLAATMHADAHTAEAIAQPHALDNNHDPGKPHPLAHRRRYTAETIARHRQDAAAIINRAEAHDTSQQAQQDGTRTALAAIVASDRAHYDPTADDHNRDTDRLATIVQTIDRNDASAIDVYDAWQAAAAIATRHAARIESSHNL